MKTSYRYYRRLKVLIDRAYLNLTVVFWLVVSHHSYVYHKRRRVLTACRRCRRFRYYFLQWIVQFSLNCYVLFFCQPQFSFILTVAKDVLNISINLLKCLFRKYSFDQRLLVWVFFFFLLLLICRAFKVLEQNGGKEGQHYFITQDLHDDEEQAVRRPLAAEGQHVLIHDDVPAVAHNDDVNRIHRKPNVVKAPPNGLQNFFIVTLN